MKFSYKFSNLLGTIYRSGNIIFTTDGNSIISPVGNRLTIYDLKNNSARTLAVESNYNYTCIALSPDGSLLLASDEHGSSQLISMVSCAVVHQHKFQDKVNCMLFSPDGLYFAVAVRNVVIIFKSPGELTGEYNPFVLQRCYLGGFDDVTWLNWSTDSRFLIVGCCDNTTKIIAIAFMHNFRTYVLSGHSDAIAACFFLENNLNALTISRNGQLCLWECSLPLSEITLSTERPIEMQNKKQKTATDEKELSDDDIEESAENNDKNILNAGHKMPADENDIKDDEERKRHPFYYKKLGRHYLADEPRKENRNALLTAADYNQRTKILVVGFSTGSFYLYDIPDINMIHSLNISNYPISVAKFNSTGDWVALASKELGQLVVWEWQSEQYIMKQQGHSSEMTCLSYSPDGHYIATGGEDAKVKLWNTQSGFCFLTFSEHSSGVTAVQFSRNKKFLVSSSLDGTVRAFDITRYRNFRTFTSPNPVQFSSVCIDYSGELVAAAAQDVFEIYLWSVKIGTLLEVLAGHTGPVSSVAFAPLPTSSTLISGSWDKTIKIWNCIETNSEHETIEMHTDVTCVTFSPNGQCAAAATLSGNIIIFDVRTATQIGTIEGRSDLTSGRLETDIITAKRNQLGRYFASIEYSADGECIIAAGNSHVVCIYHVEEATLLKKFEITQNRSFDGLNEYISRRHISEFGNLNLVEKREENEGGNVSLRLPGVRKGDMATRKYKPEVRVFCVRFSPTGQSFALACTEGLSLYALDRGVVFDPFDLSLEVTPKTIRDTLEKKEYIQALTMALKLNEINLIILVLESISYTDIQLICSNLTNDFANRLLPIIAQLLHTSVHIEFYLQWSRCLLSTHGGKDQVFKNHNLLALHESISRKYNILNRICDFNKYTMRVLFDTVDSKANANLISANKLLAEVKSTGAVPPTGMPLNNDSSDENDDDLMLIKQKQ